MAHYNYMPSNPKIGDTCSLTARYKFSEIYLDGLNLVPLTA